MIENMKHCLGRYESLEVDIEDLEYYALGPDELGVDIRNLALNARGEQQKKRGFSTRSVSKEQATSW